MIRRRSRSHLWAVLLTLAVAPASGCLPDAPPPSDPELREALGIDDRTPIHQVLLSGRGDHTRVLPAHLEVGPGDVVQFRVMDRRVHRVRFPLDDLEPAPREFLQATDQYSPAPLVEQGARLVLTFEGAPPGVYLFWVEGYGDPVQGSIRVRGS
jgi:plastocyanin